MLFLHRREALQAGESLFCALGLWGMFFLGKGLVGLLVKPITRHRPFLRTWTWSSDQNGLAPYRALVKCASPKQVVLLWTPEALRNGRPPTGFRPRRSPWSWLALACFANQFYPVWSAPKGLSEAVHTAQSLAERLPEPLPTIPSPHVGVVDHSGSPTPVADSLLVQARFSPHPERNGVQRYGSYGRRRSPPGSRAR